MSLPIPSSGARNVPPISVLIRSAPSYQREIKTFVPEWTKIIFNLDAVPFDYFHHIGYYHQFYEYVTAKGSYTPDRRFLDKVLDLIQTDQFDVNQLQTLESL